MIKAKSLFMTRIGASIVCFLSPQGRVFQACSLGQCLYSADLHSAKLNLALLKNSTNLLPHRHVKFPAQRKSTLKWNNDGELTEIDMARILEQLSSSELVQCELACDVSNNLNHK